MKYRGLIRTMVKLRPMPSSKQTGDIPLIQNLKSRRDEAAQSAMKTENQSGFTLLEIILVMLILSVLTAAAVPMVRNSVRREREIELRLALRQLRQAIDRYKEFSERNPNSIPIEWKTPTGYPKNLEILEEGFIPANVVGTSGNRVKFLRRIPVDPMTGEKIWGMRSYKDEPDSTSWGGEDIFDVYTKSGGTALNGTKYIDW